MSTTYHTPYSDDVTKFRAAHMNVPLGELDAQIVINVAAIAANLAKFGSMIAGKFVLVNEAGDALIYRDIVTSGGAVVVCSGQVVMN